MSVSFNSLFEMQGAGAGGNPAWQRNSFNSLFEMPKRAVPHSAGEIPYAGFNSLFEMHN